MTLPIEELAELLVEKYPAATLNLRRPAGVGKTWWLDLAMGPSQAEVEWHPSRGFGLNVNSDSVYGAQSDEAYPTVRAVLSRIVQLLNSGSQTEESSAQFVRALREGRRLTQVQLAKLLRVKQASVSRLENRADVHLSTLRNIVARLGGNLEVRANFPDGSIHILRYEEDVVFTQPRRPAKKRKSSMKTKAARIKKPSPLKRAVPAKRER